MATAQEPAATNPNSAAAPSNQEALAEQQQRLLERYQQLEEKLFKLYEFESARNPERASLLKKAFDQSKGRLTSRRLQQIVAALEAKDLKSAQDGQAVVLADLGEILVLLQSENRDKEVQSQIRRLQDYLKAVDRLQRMQSSIREQAEGGLDVQRLQKSQSQAIEQVQQLSRQMQQAEEGTQETKSPGSDLEQEAERQEERESSSFPEKSTRTRLDEATERMQTAQQALEQAQREESLESMQVAEEKLAEAKRELESILRQLREEEAVRKLVSLENRFRQMLERQLKILQRTTELSETPSERRGADFEIDTSRLAVDQTQLAKDADSALLIVNEDGSSPAFMQAVRMLRDDMQSVAQRLAVANVSDGTQQLERQIIESLSDMVDSLAQSQRDFQSNQQSQKSSREPGEQPLMDRIAELKMLRGMQARINARHQALIAAAEASEASRGVLERSEQRLILDRLSERQAELHQIALEILAAERRP